MASETGVFRFPGGNLDPGAQEFIPRTAIINPNNVNSHQLHHILPPPPPTLLPPQPLYFSFPQQPPPPQAVAFCEVAFPLHHNQHTTIPPPPPAHFQHPGSPVGDTPLPPPSSAPTRTLVLTSVPLDASESLIRRELELFGEVRGVQMERVREGVVTVHFYDLRHSEAALKELREQHNMHHHQQHKLRDVFDSMSINSHPPLTVARGLIGGCAVWAQFTIPICNAVPDGYNQGTIVVFNLDPNVSTECLETIFKAYGDVKELRETPLKKQQRFVEFYDVRDASKALKEMNGKEINGRPVVIEFSRPGGYSRRFFNASNNNPCYKKQVRYPGSPGSPCTMHPSSRMNSTRFGPPRNAMCSRSPRDEASVGHLCNNQSGERLYFENGGSWRRNSKSKKHSGTSNSNTHNSWKHQRRSSSKSWKGGKQEKRLDPRFLISEDAFVDQSDHNETRTTVMIKNIPNKYSQKLLLNMLDNHCIHCNEQIANSSDDLVSSDHQPLSSYDFVYLPIDFNNKCNVGYGFVNMTSPQAAWRLYKAFHHQHWEVFNSRKICEVTYARVQGLESLKEHFRNSKFPCEMDHYLPVVFSPPRDGKQLTDPVPVAGQKHLQKQLTTSSSSISSNHEDDGDNDDGHSISNSGEDEVDSEGLYCSISSSENDGDVCVGTVDDGDCDGD